jgi:thiamine pyrophosphokinase
MRRALVVGNSDLPPRALLDPWLERADLVVAADGGANRLLALGIEPDVVVGDMDSVLGSTRRRLGRDRFHPRLSAYRTDLEKAIEFAATRGAGDVTVIGASKGRIDHVHATVAVLLDWSDRLRIRLVDDDFVTERVHKSARFRAPVGTLVSLYSPSEAGGVTTSGLRWALDGVTLKRGTLGIHNHVVANPVRVSVESGELLLFRGQRVEPHR